MSDNYLKGFGFSSSDQKCQEKGCKDHVTKYIISGGKRCSPILCDKHWNFIWSMHLSWNTPIGVPYKVFAGVDFLHLLTLFEHLEHSMPEISKNQQYQAIKNMFGLPNRSPYVEMDRIELDYKYCCACGHKFEPGEKHD